MRPTNSGPLMANFHCPNCGHTETLYANAKNCKCPICNKKLVKEDKPKGIVIHPLEEDIRLERK
ncbi:MAG TPA: hypothetical protein DCZ76_12150 [Treponema sp.]|nr:hypothetical protein [Treponema sp.]